MSNTTMKVGLKKLKGISPVMYRLHSIKKIIKLFRVYGFSLEGGHYFIFSLKNIKQD